MTATSDASATYAADVARLLWPASGQAAYVTRSRHRAGQPHRDAYLFPSRRNPRLLVPAGLPGSTSMIRRLAGGRSPLVVPAVRLLERSARSRAFSLARWPMLRVPITDPSADSIERHLAECFGTEVRVGVLLGTRRVNQKPVLQVFDLQGRLVGYAKVGHTALTAALVRREAAALASVGGRRPRSFQVPELLHHGRWADLEVLVMSPLTTIPRHEVTRPVRFAAMREVAGLCGTAGMPLADSGFWRRLRGDAELLADQPHGARLVEAARTLEEHHGTDHLSLGGWHGDWGAWNMGMGDDGLQVWDWERYDAEVPIGFDGLHFDAQSVRPGDPGDRRQEETFLRSVPQTLSALDVPSDQHDLTLRLYLLEVAVRYVEGLTHGATPPLRRRVSWVLSLLERVPARVDARATKGRS
jgi:hypothetical protein